MYACTAEAPRTPTNGRMYRCWKCGRRREGARHRSLRWKCLKCMKSFACVKAGSSKSCLLRLLKLVRLPPTSHPPFTPPAPLFHPPFTQPTSPAFHSACHFSRLPRLSTPFHPPFTPPPFHPPLTPLSPAFHSEGAFHPFPIPPPNPLPPPPLPCRVRSCLHPEGIL